jgi:O-antigen ligase
MTRPAVPASTPLLGVSRALAGAGLFCLAVITLASPGATRMFAWPWSLAYAGALLAPALILLLRALDSRRPLFLPSVAWRLTACAMAAVILLSAWTSPERGPSLLWSAPLLGALAFFFVAHDVIHTSTSSSRPVLFLGLAAAAGTLTSLALWLPTTFGRSLLYIAYARNAFPLGHANYTAGLALLALPVFGTLAWRASGRLRLAWSVAAVSALIMFLSSGSRSGLAGLAALGFTALLLSPLASKKKFLAATALLAGGLVLAGAHPRTRAMFTPADPAAEPNLSNLQRSAMLKAALRMGQDRPVLGWGPGTTPLAYPRYRAGLEGGAENVLQLHSLPAQLWAELGGAGLACAAAFALLALSRARRHPLAFAVLLGYTVFSLGDWQLDVPVFGFAVALCAALLAPPAENSPASARLTLGFVTLLSLVAVGFVGRRNSAPELNVRALQLAHDPARASEAIALLQSSLVENSAQEIAHFNLGWLLVVRDPVAAEFHFQAAARLVPDKGGVYFGLGLAHLNQNHPALAARALALECLNDPLFLSSPWWREPAVAAQREATLAEFTSLASLARKKLPPGGWAATQLARVAALTIAPPAPPDRTYRRERTAYPVLMRNLDLPAPIDLYDVREPATPPPNLPPKGWLPTPLLLELLDAPPRS